MLARPPGGRTRYDRALRTVERMRSALADVPAGIASITDRPVPHLFPTTDADVFSAVLHRAVGIERPPPEVGNALRGTVSSFDPLVQLGTAGYFPRRTKHRLAVLVTDGESASYQPEAIARQLRVDRVALLVVRFWSANERVLRNGKPEPYRPSTIGLAPLRRLVATGAGLYDESEVPAALGAARRSLGQGPTAVTGRAGHRELAPYAALAAVVPLAFVLWRRDP